jgi:hypothetical protein
MSEPITRIRYGRTITIDPAVKRWSKRRKRFALLKKKIVALFTSKGFSPELIKAYMAGPKPELKGKTPKELLTPLHALRLYRFIRQDLEKPPASY